VYECTAGLTIHVTRMYVNIFAFTKRKHGRLT
jgi:hypothetical protein